MVGWFYLQFLKEEKDHQPLFWFTQQTVPGSENWTDWTNLGSPDTNVRISTNPNLSDFVIGNNRANKLQLVVADEKGVVWTIT
jgi:hypothetical protein